MAFWSRKSLNRLPKNVRFGKNDPLRKIFENFVPKEFTASQIHVLCANFVKFGRPDIGKVVRYLPDQKILKIGSLSRSRFCTDRAENLPWPVANNVLTVLQISSKSVHFRRSYSRTREDRSNALHAKCFQYEASASSPSNK